MSIPTGSVSVWFGRGRGKDARLLDEWRAAPVNYSSGHSLDRFWNTDHYDVVLGKDDSGELFKRAAALVMRNRFYPSSVIECVGDFSLANRTVQIGEIHVRRHEERIQMDHCLDLLLGFRRVRTICVESPEVDPRLRSIGVRTVPQVFRSAVLTMGGSWPRIVFDVIIPGAAPSVIGGIRLGFAYGWRALIASEMILSVGGVGFMIFQARASNLTDRLLAGMLIIGVLWALMDYFFLQPLEEGTIRRWGLVQR